MLRKLRAVVADDVDVGPLTADELRDVARGRRPRCRGSPGSGCRARPRGPVERQYCGCMLHQVGPWMTRRHRGLLEVEDHQPERRALGLAVAQEGRDRQPPAVGGDRRQGIDAAGPEAGARQRRVDAPGSSAGRVPSRLTRLSVSRPPPTSVSRRSSTGTCRRARPMAAVAPSLLGQRVRARSRRRCRRASTGACGSFWLPPWAVAERCSTNRLRVRGEDLRLHVEMRTRHVGLGGELDHLDPRGRLGVQQIGSGQGLARRGRRRHGALAHSHGRQKAKLLPRPSGTTGGAAPRSTFRPMRAHRHLPSTPTPACLCGSDSSPAAQPVKQLRQQRTPLFRAVQQPIRNWVLLKSDIDSHRSHTDRSRHDGSQTHKPSCRQKSEIEVRHTSLGPGRRICSIFSGIASSRSNSSVSTNFSFTDQIFLRMARHRTFLRACRASRPEAALPRWTDRRVGLDHVPVARHDR